jgi:3-isopropylmalate dehydrogenase
MSANKKLLILAGDGIGPEVMIQVERVTEWMTKRRTVNFDVSEGLVGGACYDACGSALTDEIMADAMGVDAVLLGAVGGPKWDDVAREHRPEAGLLRLRKEMDLYANLRPAIVFDALVDASTLKPEVVQGLDMLILRELTAGVYFGEPRGIETMPDGSRRGFDTQVYTDKEIERIACIGFEMAEKRSGRLMSVDKANVMESGVFWREIVSGIAGDYPDVELGHMYADNCAMQMVRNPKQFDVIVTDNLFGDILSDCAAMLTGSLGMLPSASLGEADESGRRRAMYEPVHGSAPDIAGKNMANPIATILSFAMCLRYSFNMAEDANLIEQAVQNVLGAGLRTADIVTESMTAISTTAMGEAIVAEMEKLVG